MEKLAAYAREKKVGLILWVVWKTLEDQLEPALDRYQSWGVKGLKVDFMQRDDQPLMRLLRAGLPRGGEAEDARRLPRRAAAGAADAHLAEPDQHRGRARASSR